MGRGLRPLKPRPSASRIIGDGAMLKWNEGVSEAANEDVRFLKNLQQDDHFCQALRAAIYAGKESCPLGVNTEPGTKKPILNYQPPD
jgi:hypothetical protein